MYIKQIALKRARSNFAHFQYFYANPFSYVLVKISVNLSFNILGEPLCWHVRCRGSERYTLVMMSTRCFLLALTEGAADLTHFRMCHFFVSKYNYTTIGSLASPALPCYCIMIHNIKVEETNKRLMDSFYLWSSSRARPTQSFKVKAVL